MKIQLIHPPHPVACDDRLDPPLGLLYLAGTIRGTGHEVEVIDLSGYPRQDWQIGQADIYGITCYIPTLAISADIARLCKAINPEAKIIGGGAGLSHLYQNGCANYIPKEFDSIIIGPGEEAILDLFEDWPDIAKIYNRPLLGSLDHYESPTYDLVDLSTYSRKIGGEYCIPILTARGCPFQCAFCTTDITVHAYSPGRIATEIGAIIDKYDIRAFNFEDDTFMLNKGRIQRLLNLIRPLGIKFRCHGRAGLDQREDYDLLKKAGCSQICWGIESGSQTILDRMRKGVSVEENKQVIQWAKDAGLLDRIFLILGFPGETRETIAETRDFIEETNPSQIFVSSFQPYPGTDVWKHPQKYGITKIYTDFTKYLQTFGDGTIGISNIDTLWMRHEEMEDAEYEFRAWVKKRPMRGFMQDYERRFQVEKSLELQDGN